MMKNILFSINALFAVLIGFGQNFSENFDDISELESEGWIMTNLSQPLGLTNWFQGNPGETFPAYEGEPDSYIAANYQNTSGSGTICNWLITPAVYVKDGDKLSFWTRTVTGSIYNDRLEVRMSQGLMTVPDNVSAVGSFTKVMTIINEDYNLSYPVFWNQYVLTVSGVGNSQVPVNFAFRYYVTNAGPSGANGNYIGIDKLNVINYGVYTISTSSAPAAGGTTSGGGVYNQGETVMLTATANEGYIFKNWQENGTVVSTNQNYSFIANENRNLVAKFKNTGNGNTYTVSTKSSPAAGGVTTGDGTYLSDTQVTVKATPSEGYEFVNWTVDGNEVSVQKIYKFNVTANTKLTAGFAKKEFKVTTKAVPAAGGTTEGDGYYVYNTKATVIATANDGYTFVNWTDADGNEVSVSKTYKFNVLANTKVFANFAKKEFKVTTKSVPTAGGITEGDGYYVYNTKATVKATPNTGYVFVNWTDADGNEVSASKTYKFNVLANTKVFANFEAVEFTVTTSSSPETGGTTTGDGIYLFKTKATVKATPNTGYVFVNWTDTDGNELSVKKTYGFKVMGDVDLTANFAPKNGSGGGSGKETRSDIFSYYPNPVKDILHIITNREIQTIKVYNLVSQEVMSIDTARIVNGEVDVRLLPPGVYVFAAVLDGGEMKTFKVVKK